MPCSRPLTVICVGNHNNFLELDIIANVIIRSIRNGTDDEAKVINRENPEIRGNQVTILRNKWEFCEIIIPRCETISDWYNNRRISLELKQPKSEYKWIFLNGDRLYYCSTPEFSDMRIVEGDHEVVGDENRYLTISGDGSFMMVKVSFWLSSELTPK